jgi:hypothetical protein
LTWAVWFSLISSFYCFYLADHWGTNWAHRWAINWAINWEKNWEKNWETKLVQLGAPVSAPLLDQEDLLLPLVKDHLNKKERTTKL